ncbi:unnamed protein product, partial [Ixodes hexagonus]
RCDAAGEARVPRIGSTESAQPPCSAGRPDMPSGWSELALQCVSRWAEKARLWAETENNTREGGFGVRDGFLWRKRSGALLSVVLLAWVAHVRPRFLVVHVAAATLACPLQGGICSVTDGMENLRAQNPTVSPASVRIKNMPR